jgi:DNA-binding transcriptional MerR regulator
MRYRIGEFARLSGASIKTLRYYDQESLLKPSQVDVRTRYRYYSPAQLQDLAAIRALQQLGASLDDIRRVISRAQDDDGRRCLLSKLRRQAQHTMHAAQRSLRWLDFELAGRPHGEPPLAVFLQRHSPMRVASIRARLARYEDIGELERELIKAVGPSVAGLRGVLWHRCEASGAIDGEPFVEVIRPVPRSGRYALNDLPGSTVASAFCEPDDDAAARAYAQIDRWVHEHDYRLAGAKREFYVGNLLQVQFPLEPA